MCKEHYYFDHAASSQPKPPFVVEAVNQHLSSVQTNPLRSSLETNDLSRFRTSLAKFLDLAPEQEVVYCANATMAANLVLLGLSSSNNHRLNILNDNYSHNCILRPSFLLGQNFSANVRTITRQDANCESLLEQIKKQPSAFILNLVAASNVTGQILGPEFYQQLAPLIIEKESWLILDCAQLVGNFSLPEIPPGLLERTAFFASGHKYLLGPEALGLLILPRNLKLPALMTGGVGFDSRSPTMPTDLPYRLEAGTYNLTAIAGLDAALGQGKTFFQKTQKRITSLATEFFQGLRRLPNFKLAAPFQPEKSTAVFSLCHNELDSGELAYILTENYRIICRQGFFCAPLTFQSLKQDFHQGATRLSFGYSTTKADVAYLLQSLEEIHS